MAFYRDHRKAQRSTAQHAPQAAQNAKKNGVDEIYHAKPEMTHIANLSLDYGQPFIQRRAYCIQIIFLHIRRWDGVISVELKKGRKILGSIIRNEIWICCHFPVVLNARPEENAQRQYNKSQLQPASRRQHVSSRLLDTFGSIISMRISSHKRNVEDHKGELWAESEGQGKRSAFHLKLTSKIPVVGAKEDSIRAEQRPRAA